MKQKKHKTLLFILLILFILEPSHGMTQSQLENRSENQPITLAGIGYRIKAGYIYHFARFTKWPALADENENQPFVVCVASTFPESDRVFSLQKKVVKGRSFVVKNYKSKSDIETCHILFIASDDKEFISEKLDDAKNYNVLTIGEENEFVEMGGIINFYLEKQRLRFAVNMKAARQANLKFSAQMLMSAKIIPDGPQ